MMKKTPDTEITRVGSFFELENYFFNLLDK